MTKLQFRDLVHEVEPRVAEAAQTLGATPTQIRAWAEGTEKVPALVARKLDWRFKALFTRGKNKSLG